MIVSVNSASLYTSCIIHLLVLAKFGCTTIFKIICAKDFLLEVEEEEEEEEQEEEEEEEFLLIYLFLLMYPLKVFSEMGNFTSITASSVISSRSEAPITLNV